jgi:hypothetical protein
MLDEFQKNIVREKERMDKEDYIRFIQSTETEYSFLISGREKVVRYHPELTKKLKKRLKNSLWVEEILRNGIVNTYRYYFDHNGEIHNVYLGVEWIPEFSLEQYTYSAIIDDSKQYKHLREAIKELPEYRLYTILKS